MIKLNDNVFLFKTESGEVVPCSLYDLEFELQGSLPKELERYDLYQIARAVAFFFNEELGQNVIDLKDFASILEQLINSIPFTENPDVFSSRKNPVTKTYELPDLWNKDAGLELSFFNELREIITSDVSKFDCLRFNGLSECVKAIVGAKRWSKKCSRLADEIVEFLRLIFAKNSYVHGKMLIIVK
jgi:hypothetical protein